LGEGRGGDVRWATAALAACAALAAPATASAESSDYLAATHPVLRGTTISLTEGSRAEIFRRVVVTGRIPVAGPNQWVTVTVDREGRQVRSRRVPTDAVSGRYRMRMRLKGCCEYVARAVHGTDASEPLAFRVSGPSELEPGRQTLLFNRLLEQNGYHMGEVTGEAGESTELGIMALRKVNELPRTGSYAPRLFELLLEGDAGFEPVHREEGRHVEVDISRQVMALIEDGEATDVFHVSTGAGGTPTGEWSFYDKGPGYNAKGMYYSIYYDGNYATHGYSSVPTYPASHGCTRNPMSYAVFIYNWIDLGDMIYVYA
jgi:hypothetical protein